MKNYYEILEVNQKASKEVIEKAYRVLVGKYHPDLYIGEKQQYAEMKTKEINEAYHVLSDEFLREQYNIELEREEGMYQQNNEQVQARKMNMRANARPTKSKEKNVLQKKDKNPKIGSFASILQLIKELIQDLAKSKEKQEGTKKVTKIDVFAIILTIIVVVLIGVILWFIPFTNGWMRELLFENPLFNWIGGLFSK